MIFYWLSDALENYSQGHILATGATVEEARQQARESFKAYAADHWPYLFEPGYELDSWDTEQRDEITAKFESDIAKEPAQLRAVLIGGSE